MPFTRMVLLTSAVSVGAAMLWLDLRFVFPLRRALLILVDMK
jgi:hypothetical protein